MNVNALVALYCDALDPTPNVSNVSTLAWTLIKMRNNELFVSLPRVQADVCRRIASHLIAGDY